MTTENAARKYENPSVPGNEDPTNLETLVLKSCKVTVKTKYLVSLLLNKMRSE